MMFDSVPGGKFKSYEISIKDKKAIATFVRSDDQDGSKDYYAAHYKTCTAKGEGSGRAAHGGAPRAVSGGDGAGFVKVGGKEYEIRLFEVKPGPDNSL